MSLATNKLLKYLTTIFVRRNVIAGLNNRHLGIFTLVAQECFDDLALLINFITANKNQL